MENDNSRGDIVVLAEASSIERWRKQVAAGQPGSGMHAFISDVGNYMPGGEGTAPTGQPHSDHAEPQVEWAAF